MIHGQTFSDGTGPQRQPLVALACEDLSREVTAQSEAIQHLERMLGPILGMPLLPPPGGGGVPTLGVSTLPDAPPPLVGTLRSLRSGIESNTQAIRALISRVEV